MYHRRPAYCVVYSKQNTKKDMSFLSFRLFLLIWISESAQHAFLFTVKRLQRKLASFSPAI